MLFFKFPFRSEIFTTDGTVGNTPVSFVSFDEKELVEFGGNITEVPNVDFLRMDLPAISYEDSDRSNFQEETKDEYTHKVKNVINFVNKHHLPKLVLSRQKYVPYRSLSAGGEIDLKKTFLNLCASYPNAFVYVFQKDGHCWIGAFSELLGRFNKQTSVFETMSLAGTLPLAEEWSEKEIEEQQPVSTYIKEILKRYSADIDISDTYDHHSGSIKHLRTDYKATIAKAKLEMLISDLHPTPAVCGFPKEFCRKAITAFEKHPRALYSGYIRIETKNYVQFFVNLRCARLTTSGAHLYVGGGINSKSDPEKEWRETELKAEAVLKNLATKA